MANITVTSASGNNVNVAVTPVPKQTIQINKGVQGSPGPNQIAGYPIVMSNIQQKDVVMFGVNQWNNVPQTEISDGGNF